MQQASRVNLTINPFGDKANLDKLFHAFMILAPSSLNPPPKSCPKPNRPMTSRLRASQYLNRSLEVGQAYVARFTTSCMFRVEEPPSASVRFSKDATSWKLRTSDNEIHMQEFAYSIDRCVDVCLTGSDHFHRESRSDKIPHPLVFRFTFDPSKRASQHAAYSTTDRLTTG